MLLEIMMNNIITNIIDKFNTDPYGFYEDKNHHERALHYWHNDFFIENFDTSKYNLRWEFPTYQKYRREKIDSLSTLKLYVDEEKNPGFIDIVIKDSDNTNPVIDYGFEYGLFTCDKSEEDFRIKIENDVLKLTDPVNNISNKYILYFFRCNDFNRTTPQKIQDRIDTVLVRSKRLSEIMFETCENAGSDSLEAIFVEAIVTDGKIKYDIRKLG